MNAQREKLRMMLTSAIFAAIIGILAQVTIPLPLVPITGQTLAVGLAATILGSKYGALSALLYMLLGAVGVPVFSGMSGGMGIIVGPTGGFIVSFIISAFVIGWYIEATKATVTHAFIANVIGMFINLFMGTAWLKVAASLSWPEAFAAGFLPFLIGGVIKALLSAWLGIEIRKRLASARLLPYSSSKRTA
ncbi:biotin transporter BioY [Bacillus thermotolerans]|uniref:Biotin transporter n=1 Tax=Bacillus thermotolerans TaxID=1221996 RepID=A0A0F5HMZ8_BACTR|nr:biotin transporter BioY [Bacillus thermotolerans]KKB34671.1 Substrate-specific component BioY of biotin ECF transporter [Bacillus thermotolerans]KKB35710.1 Substrate-specific component BioY of biotin ECF transporter [Bacillus thermotolerans]KKB38555.1 Substrate-specific component BioY of biotin ECF transporter [Bacillus thermotolerans]